MSQHPGPHPESHPLDTAAASATWPPDLSNVPARPEAIGGYHIIEQLGSGGMGVVYKAEQLRPVRRIVAIKLIKLGMDTPQVVARFHSERQALASLEHPGIARIYDAGATDTGRPYFVMEFVPGEPITEFCDALRLTTEARLVLFEQICHIVQHAHFKGVLHRDLKPSNILVSAEEGLPPQPKIIDFGVAKAVAGESSNPALTQLGQFIGTPLYTSPEQLAAAEDVDTRADVYSLGVVLYELLAGVLPFEQVERTRDTEPPRPSARISALEAPTSLPLAQRRGTEPATLLRQLRGDLDRIVLKALEPDRSRRYPTAAALAEDVRRYLAHEPITARPPTLMYQARKFARRNRVLVSASMAVLAAIVIGAAAAGIGLIRARQALVRETAALNSEKASRLVAENVTVFLRDMLGSVNPERAQGATVLVRDVLDRASAELPSRFQDQPVVASQLHGIIGDTYHALGLFDLALKHNTLAYEQRRAALGESHDGTLAAAHQVGTTLSSLGRWNEANTILRDVYEQRRKVTGPEAPETLAAGQALALTLLAADRFAEAEPLQRHVLETRLRLNGPDAPDTLTAMQNLAPILQQLGRLDECEDLYRRSSETRQRVLGANHPDTLMARGNLAAVMVRRGRLAEAEAVFRDVLERRQRIQGKDHKNTLETANNLAYTLQSAARHAEAEVMYRDLLERLRRALPENHRTTLATMGNLATTLEAQQKNEEALGWFGDLYQRALVAQITPSAVVRYTSPYGVRLARAGRYAEAEGPLLEARRRMEAANLTQTVNMREVLTSLAEVCQHTGREQEAARYRAEAAKLASPPSSAASTSASTR
jgi:non-specific serine/threonine protein kinase/serine/threonine-protein kinase